MELTIDIEDINYAEAAELINELSDELERITDNGGKSSFDNADIDNKRSIFVIA